MQNLLLRLRFWISFAATCLGCWSCAGLTPVFPERPPATQGMPVADPIPARMTVHTTVSHAALVKMLEGTLPLTADGTVPVLRSERKFTWKRDAITLRFAQGRIGLELHLAVHVDMPISSLEFPLEVRVLAEPVVAADYVARLQSLEVSVSSPDTRLALANVATGVLEKIRTGIQQRLEAFTYDLLPVVLELYTKVSEPLMLPLGEASGCAELQILGVEAGPTVLANGVEKDLALVVAPRVTLPCQAAAPAPLPPLANVTHSQGGPFTISVPIAARYEELTKAMALTFTNGRLYFSKEYPALYMEKPEVYASQDQVVLKLHIAGVVHKFWSDSTIDGNIFFAGHPQVEDNELRVPDLEPTVETKSVLLKLKAWLQGDSIRDEARAALRLDLSERLQAVRDKLSKNLELVSGQGCLKARADKIEVTGVHAHGSYLRVYVAMTGQASAYMPCP